MSFSSTEISDFYERLGGSYFAYDLDALSRHLSSLSSEGLRLWYACKANPLSSVLTTMRENGFSVDVASPGELQQALLSGVDKKNILLTGPVKSDQFLDLAFTSGVEWFVAESPKQLERISTFAEKFDRPANVLIRLQLDWEEGGVSVLG